MLDVAEHIFWVLNLDYQWCHKDSDKQLYTNPDVVISRFLARCYALMLVTANCDLDS